MRAPGFANSVEQDKFCAGTDCTITRIYDQSPRLNHLDTAPAGEAHWLPDAGVNATRNKITIGGNVSHVILSDLSPLLLTLSFGRLFTERTSKVVWDIAATRPQG